MTSKRVLVVDPSEQARETIAEIFKLRGDEVVFAKDEPEALGLFNPGAFDLVLTEALLPRGGGFSFCREARRLEAGNERPSHTPLLIMSAIMRNMKFVMEAKTSYGADETLVKPFDAHDLRRKLALFLDQYDADKEDQAEIDYFEVPLDGKPRVRVYVEPLRLSGRLSCVPFARVLGSVAQLGETGVLRVRSGSVEKTFHFQNGRLVFVAGGPRRERLTWLLTRAGRLDREGAVRALSAMRDGARKFGETLLENQLISSHDLYQFLQLEMEEKTLNCFRWCTGEFQFEPAAQAAPPDAASMSLDVYSLVRRGVEENYSPASLRREFEPWNADLVRVNPTNVDSFDYLRPSRAERRIWEKLKAGERVDAVIDGGDMEPAAAQRFLFVLLCLDLAQFELSPSIPPIPRNLLTPAGDLTFRGQTVERFARASATPLEELLRPENGDAAADLDEAHVNACQNLFHKRLFRGLDPFARACAEAVFARLEEAHAAAGGRTTDGSRANSTGRGRAGAVEAELAFQRGLEALAAGNFIEAGDIFQSAVDLDDRVADYHAYLGYARFRQQADVEHVDPTLATRSLTHALELDYHLPEAHRFLGEIHRRLGQEKRAEECFARALQFDQNDLAALKQLREIYSSREADAPKRPDSADGEETRRRIKELFAKMQSMDYFAALDVGRDVEGRDLRKAYFERTARFRAADDPDALDALTREQAAEIFHRLSAAYSTLADPDSRTKYLRRLAEEAELAQRGPASPADQRAAADHFQRGQRAMQNKEYKAAVGHFDRAWRSEPLNARHLAWLGWAKFAAQSPGGEETAQAEARACLRRALALNPRCVDAFLLFGRLYWQENKPRLARDQFDNAVSIAPDDLAALKAYAMAHLPDEAAGMRFYHIVDSEAERQYVALGVRLDELAAKDCFDVLGVGLNVAVADVKKAYDAKHAQFLAAFSPEQLTGDGRFRADEIRARFDRAFRILSDDHLRACCRAAVSDQPRVKPAPEPAADDAAAAEGDDAQAAADKSAPTTKETKEMVKPTAIKGAAKEKKKEKKEKKKEKKTKKAAKEAAGKAAAVVAKKRKPAKGPLLGRLKKLFRRE